MHECLPHATSVGQAPTFDQRDAEWPSPTGAASLNTVHLNTVQSSGCPQPCTHPEAE
jgi:hypothetical protein